jgi:multidrug efflux pump subunit AcrA (membrane-fusion protein)
MTDYTDEDFDTNEIDEQEDASPRGLRRAANKSKKLEQELNELRRELAFARAGLPLDDPKMKYFIKGYDGELSAESVRQAALEAGFLASQDQGPDPQLEQAAAAQSRVMSASAGAIMEDASEEAALARLEMAMEEGGVEAMLEVARQYGIPTNIEQ